jgi:hypothetical protein
MNLFIALVIIALPVGLYAIIRYRGASIMATYHAGGIGAVLVGFQTFIVATIGALAAALPDILTAVSGYDLRAMLPAPWGQWVAFAVAVIIPLLRGLATTPSGTKPSGEA